MVCVGVVTGAHGVRGQIRVRSFTSNPADVAAYGPVRDTDGTPLTLTVTGESRGQMLARVTGVDDRTTAESLKGRRLYVPRAALPPTDEDEYYHTDLVGLRVEHMGAAEGVGPGTVTAVHDHGAGAVLEVSDGGTSILVPFTYDAVPVVDLAGGRIVVAPLPGLFGDSGKDGEMEP